MSAEQLIIKHLDIWTSAHKTRSSAGRGSSNKLDLYGIKKLRELILELAVRGKLVPQDPNDEPASELLKKIENEKKKLLTEGKIKKEKALPKISPEEILSELPFNWCWTQLGLITNYGTTTKVDSIESDCWVLDLEDIEKDTSKLIQKVRFSERASLSDKNSFSRGDVLYGKLRPYLNKVIVADEDGVCTTEILPIRPYIELNSEYLKIVLKSPSFLNYVNDRSYGMKMPRLGTDDGRKATVPLAPLAEQHRIVSKVNELMAFCDELEQVQTDNIAAHEQLVEALLTTLTNSKDHQELQANWQRIAEHFDTLFTTEDSIDQLKQTILQLAVMGKLVPQDPNDEPVHKLYSRIKLNESIRIKNREIQKPKKVLELAEPEARIPSSWSYYQVGSLAFVTKLAGFEYTEYMAQIISDDGEIPVIRAQNVRPFKPDLRNLKYIDLDTSTKLQRCALDSPCLLMTFIGAGIGDTCVFKDTNRWHLAPNVAKIEPFADICLDFLAVYLNSEHGRKEIFKSMKSTAQPSLSMTTIREIWIPLPPLPEQYRIAKKVHEFMALSDTLKDSVKDIQLTQLALVDVLVEQVIS